METLERKNLIKFALEAFRKLPLARLYALTDSAKMVLACLAAELKRDREARNLTDDDAPKAQSQFVGVLEHLVKAGCNLIQQRPEGEAKPLPKLWRHPISGEPLPAPQGPDERGILASTDPELLKWFDEMEKHPYKTVTKLREAEAKRKLLEAVPYTEIEHVANPWRTGSLKMQDEVVRRGPPELVTFYKAEARDVEIPIFGASFNLSVLSRLARDNPDTRELIERAERIHKDWRNQDQLAAQEQRQKAEATLKRLQAEAA
jgi:hypothetical protein